MTRLAIIFPLLFLWLSVQPAGATRADGPRLKCGLVSWILRSYVSSRTHTDHRGNTIALTADNGTAVLDHLEYTPYGVETWRQGAYDTPCRFCGAFGIQTDPNGLCQMRARYYSPYLMRFLNADPIGFSGGSNWFAYADGNPISKMNPFGLAAERNSVGSIVGHMSNGGYGANPKTGQMGYIDAFGDWHQSFCMSCHDFTNPTAARNFQAVLGGDTGWVIFGRDVALMLSPLAEMGISKGLTSLGSAGMRAAALAEREAMAVAQASDDFVTLFHQGSLRGGQVSSTRALSTSTSRGLGHYHPGGQLYEFQIPKNTYNQWIDDGIVQPFSDTHLPTGLVTPETRILPPAAGELNKFLIQPKGL